MEMKRRETTASLTDAAPYHNARVGRQGIETLDFPKFQSIVLPALARRLQLKIWREIDWRASTAENPTALAFRCKAALEIHRVLEAAS
jgi:hypothetical protein